MNLSNTGFTQNAIRKRDSQNIYLTFTYKFGNMFDEQKKFQKRKRGEDNKNNNDVPEEDY